MAKIHEDSLTTDKSFINCTGFKCIALCSGCQKSLWRSLGVCPWVSRPLASERSRTVFLEDSVASVAGGAAVAMTLFCRAGVRGFGLRRSHNGWWKPNRYHGSHNHSWWLWTHGDFTMPFDYTDYTDYTDYDYTQPGFTFLTAVAREGNSKHTEPPSSCGVWIWTSKQHDMMWIGMLHDVTYQWMTRVVIDTYDHHGKYSPGPYLLMSSCRRFFFHTSS